VASRPVGESLCPGDGLGRDLRQTAELEVHRVTLGLPPLVQRGQSVGAQAALRRASQFGG
jgi:hypothetical protein